MKKLLLLVAAAAATAAVAAASLAPAAATPKTWVCHKANANKYVAILVSGRAALRGHMRHGDIAVMPAPTQTTRAAQRAAARAFCATLPVTAARGGVRLETTLTGVAGVSANVAIRTQLGQNRVCFTVNLTAPAGTTATTLTLLQGATSVVTTNVTLSGNTASGCLTVPKATIKQLLRNPSGFSIRLVTSAGTITGTLSQ